MTRDQDKPTVHHQTDLTEDDNKTNNFIHVSNSVIDDKKIKQDAIMTKVNRPKTPSRTIDGNFTTTPLT